MALDFDKPYKKLWYLMIPTGELERTKAFLAETLEHVRTDLLKNEAFWERD